MPQAAGAGGRLIYDGRAALWHHESATRAADRPQFNARVAANRETYIGTLGAAHLPRRAARRARRRLAVLERAVPRRHHVDGRRAAGTRWALHRTTAGRRVGGARLAGQLPGTSPTTWLPWTDPSRRSSSSTTRGHPASCRGRLVTMAWLRDEPERWCGRVWFDEFDLVFASGDAPSRRSGPERQGRPAACRSRPMRPVTASGDPFLAVASAVRDALVGWASATRYGLRIGVPSWDVIDRWGDYHFARGLQRALERAGHPTRLHFLPDWDSAPAARDDVAVHLFGLKEAPTRRGQVNILWQISHPDLATPEIYERYDHVFVASDPFAARMAERVAGPGHAAPPGDGSGALPPEPGGPHHELLFVANSRRVHRRSSTTWRARRETSRSTVANWTPRAGRPALRQGRGRPQHRARALLQRRRHRAQRPLGRHARRGVPLEPPLRRARLRGVRHLRPGRRHRGRVRRRGPDLRHASELEPLIDRYLDDPDERQRLAAHGRAVVLARHTLDRRARVLCEVAEPLASARRGQQDRPDRTAPVEDVPASPEVAASGTHR